MSIFLTHYANKVHPTDNFAPEAATEAKAELLETADNLKSYLGVMKSNFWPVINKDGYSYSLNMMIDNIIAEIQNASNNIEYVMDEILESIQEGREKSA